MHPNMDIPSFLVHKKLQQSFDVYRTTNKDDIGMSSGNKLHESAV